MHWAQVKQEVHLKLGEDATGYGVPGARPEGTAKLERMASPGGPQASKSELYSSPAYEIENWNATPKCFLYRETLQVLDTAYLRPRCLHTEK